MQKYNYSNIPAKRGMKISDPIFPIEMDLAKRGINVKTKRGIFTVEMEY